MSLFDRVVCKTPLGHSGVWFRLWWYGKDEKKSGISSFIVIVMERYARRFGNVKDDDAHDLHMRLAVKYSNNPSSTIKSLYLRNEGGVFYPRKTAFKLNKIAIEKAKQDKENELVVFNRRKKVNYGLKNPCGDYCLIDYTVGQGNKCRCCGKVIFYDKSGVDNVVSHVFEGVYLNGWHVCKDKRCRAVAVFCSQGRGQEPLIKIINEVTKHGGNNENKRRLEKHFIRHA